VKGFSQKTTPAGYRVNRRRRACGVAFPPKIRQYFDGTYELCACYFEVIEIFRNLLRS
jgi:hypothetical protein